MKRFVFNVSAGPPLPPDASEVDQANQSGDRCGTRAVTPTIPSASRKVKTKALTAGTSLAAREPTGDLAMTYRLKENEAAREGIACLNAWRPPDPLHARFSFIRVQPAARSPPLTNRRAFQRLLRVKMGRLTCIGSFPRGQCA